MFRNKNITTYNRNYGGFDYVRIPAELLNAVNNQKVTVYLPVTTAIHKRCGAYTKKMKK